MASLEPLAAALLRQGPEDPEAAAAAFVDPARGAADAGEALSGTRDILAEGFSEDAGALATLEGN